MGSKSSPGIQTSDAGLGAGFADPVFQSQAVFRAVMMALAEPGKTFAFPAIGLKPPQPQPLSDEAAAVVLALADFETSVWLDPRLAAGGAAALFVRFHTGAVIAQLRTSATFAVIADVTAIPRLDTFALGDPAYPDRATTLIIQVERLLDTGMVFEGPGIDGQRAFGVEPMIADFAAQWRANRALFPLGVDILFVAPGAIAALPRSSRLVEG
jgi:alpha-D-ribose 1-methylphosphonate 5-triphosphate synthase subunit PhnH